MEYFDNDNFALDDLTGVYRREVIVDYINHLVLKEIPFSLALIDVDNFKYVNDTFGHLTGDKIIQEVAKKLKSLIKDVGVVGRFGGDEFILVFEGIIEYNELWSICHNKIGKINGLTLKEFNGLNITITQGLSRFPQNGKNYTELLETADKALYRGKTKGRNCFIIYLDEKHKNIKLKSDSDSALSSMYLHSNIFKLLSASENLKQNILDLFNFFSSYLMIDHICLQDNANIIMNKVHSLSVNEEFQFIPHNLIENLLNKSSELMYINNVFNLEATHQFELFSCLRKQNITSHFSCLISYKDKIYGTLRCDMTSSNRIWQYGDMDLLLTAAKTIGLILHYHNITLTDLL